MPDPAGKGPLQGKAHLANSFRRTADAIRYCAGLLFHNAPVATALFVVGNVVTGVATPIVVWAMDGLINEVSGEIRDPWLQVLPWLAALSAALILRGGRAAFTDYVANVIRQRVDGAMYRDVYEKAIQIPLGAFESRTYYDKLETGKRAIAGHLLTN